MRSGIGNSPSDPFYVAQTSATTDSNGNPINTTQQVAATPSTSSASAIAPVRSADGFSAVLKASAGNVYGATVTAGATAGFLILYNATTAPANAAALTANLVLAVVAVAANQSAALGEYTVPVRAGTGAVILFSTSTTTNTNPANAALFLAGRAV